VNWNEMSLHRRLYFCAGACFVAGVLVGAAVFVLAASYDSSGTNVVVIGGQSYATDPADSKSYDGQLERMGGRSLVFADQFNRWFGSLWHGENLGLTIAVLASALALILLWIGREVERDHDYRSRSRPDPD
jgi:hypothetical protein